MPTYRVVIADDDAPSRDVLSNILRAAGHSVLAETSWNSVSVKDLREILPDALFVADPISGYGGNALKELVSATPVSAIILLADEGSSPLSWLGEMAILGCLVKPFVQLQVLATLEIAISRRRETLQLTSNLHLAQDTLDTRKLVDRAKALLMAAFQLSETEAFRRLQQESMNSRKSMKDVAGRVVAAHGRGTPESESPSS